MTEERVFYADANGVRISASRLVFGSHTYATRNVSSAFFIEERGITWPAYLVIVGGLGLLAWGALGSPTWGVVGFLGIVSGLFNLSRKKRRRNYSIRLTTAKGPVLVLASRNRAYVDRIVPALHKAMALAREAHPLPDSDPVPEPALSATRPAPGAAKGTPSPPRPQGRPRSRGGRRRRR